jgi:hypothetical protein
MVALPGAGRFLSQIEVEAGCHGRARAASPARRASFVCPFCVSPGGGAFACGSGMLAGLESSAADRLRPRGCPVGGSS